jgi:hypothetical protein
VQVNTPTIRNVPFYDGVQTSRPLMCPWQASVARAENQKA